MELKKLGELTDQSLRELNKIQKGERRLVKTGFCMIDDHIKGLLPGDCVILSGLSGHGKSETLFRLRDSVMDVKVNPDANDYLWCNFNLEVRSFNVTLRSLNRILKKKKQDILFKVFDESEKKQVEKFHKENQDDRQFVCQDNISALDFYNICKGFLINNKQKKAVNISFDHAALLNGNDIQKSIEELIKYVNQLKLEFDNVYFYIVSQLNRAILGRIAEKSNMSCPNASDLYASSAMDFISSYNIIVFDAHKIGISEFMKVSPERYDYLSEHFTEQDSKGKVSFMTEGKLFYKVVKTRESDVMWKDLYIIDKDISEDEKEVLKKEKEVSTSNPILNTPVFEPEIVDFKHLPKNADDAPF